MSGGSGLRITDIKAEVDATRKDRDHLQVENDRLAADLRSSVEEGTKVARENLRITDQLARMRSGMARPATVEPEATSGAKATNELSRLRNYLFRDWPGPVQDGDADGGTADIAIRILRMAMDDSRDLAELWEYLAREYLERTEELEDPDPVALAIKLLGEHREEEALGSGKLLVETLADEVTRLEEELEAYKRDKRGKFEEVDLGWAEEEVSDLSKYLLDVWAEELDDAKSPAENAIELIARLAAVVKIARVKPPSKNPVEQLDQAMDLAKPGGSGSKYHREIRPLDGYKTPHVDVYRVLYAFNVVSPGLQHAIKKLLCAGIRGKGGHAQDLREAIDAIVAELDYTKATKEW